MAPRLQQLALCRRQRGFSLASTLTCHNVEDIDTMACHQRKHGCIGCLLTPLPDGDCLSGNLACLSHFELLHADTDALKAQALPKRNKFVIQVC